MSRVVAGHEYDSGSYELGEMVYFDHDGERLCGEVARVYNSRTLYHVEVAGVRYEVAPDRDNMSRSG